MMEGNHHGTEFSIISKPAEKFIQIDSIFIDIFSSNDRSDGRKFEHFSIRGYVSDMRKKDWKICWPFPVLDDDHKSDEQIPLLPPICDPHFNWRHGQSCWQENSDKGAVEGRCLSDSCLNLGNYPSFQKARKDGVIDGRMVNAVASFNLSCQPSCSDESEKKFEVADKSTVALISQSEPGCVRHDVKEIEHLKVTEENPEANFQAGKLTLSDHPDGQLTLVVSENDSEVKVHQAHYTVKFQTSGDPCMELNENTCGASESAEIVGNNVHDCHLEKLHRRKTRKIRLLTELLGENENMKVKHVESSTCNGTPDASAKPDVKSSSKCHLTIQENILLSDHNRKKRLIRDETSRHQEVPSSSHVDRQIQTWRRDIETPMSSSETETENAFSGTILQTKNSLWSSCKMDGNHTASKKKSKKSQVVDPCSMSLLPSRHSDLYEIQETTGYRSDGHVLDNATIKVHNNEFSSKIPHSISWNATEPKSSTCKNPNTGKQSLIDEGPITLFPWNNGIIRKGSFAQKDVEIMKNRTVAINPFQYENYDSNERELPLSLNNYLNSQGYHKRIAPQGKNVLPTLLTEQDDNSQVINVSRKDTRINCLGDPNPLFKAADVFYGRGVHGELDSKMANFRIPLPHRNQRLDPPTDIGWSRMRQKNMYSGSSGRKKFEAKESLPLSKRHSNQRVDLASDHGTLDDIPMEIVELMAKNQYERFLHDAENNKHLSEASKSSRNVQMNDYGHIYRNGMGLLENPENLRQKPQARNGGNVSISEGKIVEARKQKSSDYFSNIDERHFNMNHLQQTRMLGHNASIHSQEKPSSSIQFSPIGSKRKGWTENMKYNGSIVESGSNNSKMRSFERCIDHPPVSERNIEAAHIWSSMMPDHLSYGYQRVPSQSTERENISSPRSLHMGNVNSQNYQDHHPTNLEMHGRNYSSEACSQKIAESPFYSHSNVIELHPNPDSSLELYSNETIPAMHLLSLMDAQSNAPITAGGTHKLSKKPPIPRPLKGKEFSGMDIGSNRTFHAITYPSSSFYDEGHIPEKFHYHSPAAPSISASACPFQHNKVFETSPDFTGQAVLRSRNRGKKKCSDGPAWKEGQKPLKSAFRSGGLGTDTAAFPVNGIHTKFVSASKSKEFTLARHEEKNSKDCKLLAHANILQSQKSTFETEICSINKNPAEFSLPEAGNSYMIGAEDFNFGRTVHSKNRPISINFNEFKRKRSM